MKLDRDHWKSIRTSCNIEEYRTYKLLDTTKSFNETPKRNGKGVYLYTSLLYR